MQPLGRTEDLTAEAVGDHDVVANAEAIHETLFGQAGTCDEFTRKDKRNLQ